MRMARRPNRAADRSHAVTPAPSPRGPADPLTSASVTTAWVVALNKPLYPLDVWWLVGSGVRASLFTLVALPLYAAIPYVARRWPDRARVGLTLVGVGDTALVTMLFGQSSGVAAFFIPCAALAALSFTGAEAWTSRALTALVFVVFTGLHLIAPTGLYRWPPAEAAVLLNLNLLSAASLTAFVGFRFASARR